MGTLPERLRALLADEAVREVSMFGARAFMVDGAMVVAAHGDGSLLVRVDPERSAELLDRPGAAQAEMGVGRSMGPSWVTVAADALVGEGLDYWLGAAMEFRRRRDLSP